MMNAATAELLAHSRNESGIRQGLEEHLRNVACLSQSFAGIFSEEHAARIAGLLHDLGKAKQSWQDRLRALESGLAPAWDELLHDHKMASAAYAWKEGMCDIAQVIAGHHGGMPNFGDLQRTMRSGLYDAGMQEAYSRMQDYLRDITAYAPNGDSRSFYRLLLIFSCLVDADSIDTSGHFKDRMEPSCASLGDLNAKVLAEQPRVSFVSESVLALRDSIRKACLGAVTHKKGFFSLNAPTGSGKTISGAIFGLGHAAHHKMSRVVYVAPYRSIIDQTAGVYKLIFGEENVLAHHSTSDFWTNNTDEGRLQRQIAENWADIPVIVTTAEQFFESAYSSRPGASRKLHNVVNSVILIDELQAIPLHLLTPCIALLKILVRDFGCTIAVMTGTMPPLHHEALLGSQSEVTPIVSGRSATCRRVRVFKSRFNKCYPSTVAAFMRKHKQALSIANTRSGALDIYNGLPIASRIYISTWLCPSHRAEIIENVRTKLGNGSACHVASTQVIEAGVDFDFPDLLLREKGPLDSMIQAFGRCNRNGRGKGHCYIFSPASGNKLSDYEAGIAVVDELLYKRKLNPHAPRTLELYYEMLYSKKNLDTGSIMSHVEKLNFQSVRDEFRLIVNNQINVVVAYGTAEQQSKQRQAVSAIKRGIADGLPADTFRWAVRRLQGYVVSLYPENFEKLSNAFPHAVETLFLNYFLWKGDYSQRVGLGNVVASL